MPPDERSFLSGIELFVTLSGEDLRDLAGRLPNISLGDNQIFYTPGHRGESFFLLLSCSFRAGCGYTGCGRRGRSPSP